ncbi:molybdopterin-containing oxidoreductase family protein [Seleniivibrio woodruffii]|uniref:Thiosulfate reductase/polysulfide reductase chain A n=1 Tax=Seleniivibrio woodruffii TaxID=1078050 RepID=A0A4R1KBT5_9BACT|nr:molybdopterin-dependent oxidoreductase [Seleniivibrio woodruffii]TCK61965.1 thiosulfate reductase/polysulfide reductase chain A [Seleniivibrio woodruffii]TVZ34918.1 thiosulfate reductase/polysulfide reductase chain A [Seleniivibrio woodruffii]
MIKNRISRRRFLQGTLATGAAAASLSSISLIAGEVSQPAPTGVTYAQNWCEMCFWKCGLTAKVVDGKVHKLEGQKDCPSNRGKLCAKGNAGIAQLYDPDRLQKPLIRTGERGSGQFKEVSWDEAIKYVAEKCNGLKEKYGSGTFSLFAHGSGEHAFVDLLHIMGSPNICIPSYSQCTGSRDIGWALTYGKPVGGKEPVDSENAKCIMLLGRNIAEALHMGELIDFINGCANGAYVIYVDPRYNKTAAKANKYMMIKPGTDTALVLAMINYIIVKEIYNKEFVEKYTYGLEELSAHVRRYTTKWASEVTEIPEKDIIEAAVKLCEAAPNCYIHPGRRLTRYGSDTQFVRAIAILNALMGNWETPGGIFKPVPLKFDTPHMVHDLEKVDAERADGAGTEFPIASVDLGLANKMMQAIAEQKHPLKGMFVYGCNPFHNQGSTDVVAKAIEASEFIVTCEIYMTDTAWYSDVILPESTYLERYDPIISTARKSGYIQFREPAVKPLHDTLGAWEIAARLSKAMGYQNHFMDVREYNTELLESLGLSEKVMQKHGSLVGAEGDPFPLASGIEPEFHTPSGKIELFSNMLNDLGYDPLPSYQAPPMPKADEFRLLFGRVSFHTHARTQNNEWLLALHHSEVELWINSGRAKALGIKNGDKVCVTKGNKKSNPCIAKVVDHIHRDAVFLPHGFGSVSKGLTRISGVGARDSDFTSDETDPISGGAGFHNGFVRIVKA